MTDTLAADFAELIALEVKEQIDKLLGPALENLLLDRLASAVTDAVVPTVTTAINMVVGPAVEAEVDRRLGQAVDFAVGRALALVGRERQGAACATPRTEEPDSGDSEAV